MMIRQTDDQAFSRDSKRERPLSVITHLKRGGGGGGRPCTSGKPLNVGSHNLVKLGGIPRC
jgi:hypothetical protein